MPIISQQNWKKRNKEKGLDDGEQKLVNVHGR